MKVELGFMFSGHRLMTLYKRISTKCRENSQRYQSYGTDTIFILEFTKGHNSAKMEVELWFLFSAYGLLMLYICTKLCETVSNCRLSELRSGHEW